MQLAIKLVKSLPAWVKLAVRLAVTLGLYALLLFSVDATELLQLLGDIDWRWLSLALAIPTIGIPLSALRWQLLLRQYSVVRPYRELLLRYWSGSFYNTVLPGSVSGDVIRVSGLSRSGVPLATSTFSVLADRVIGLWICMVLGLLSAMWPSNLPHRYLLGAIFAVGIGGSVLGLWFLSQVQRWRWKRLDRPRSLLALTRVRPRPALVLLAVAFQWLVVLHLYVVALALHAPISLLACGVYMPAVVLATLLPISLNGMGVREAVLTLLLAGIGVSPERATLIGLMMMTTSTISSLPGGITTLLLSFWIKHDVQTSTS